MLFVLLFGVGCLVLCVCLLVVVSGRCLLLVVTCSLFVVYCLMFCCCLLVIDYCCLFRGSCFLPLASCCVLFVFVGFLCSFLVSFVFVLMIVPRCRFLVPC